MIFVGDIDHFFLSFQIDDKYNDLSNSRKKYYTAAELRLHPTYQSNNRGGAISKDDFTSHNDQYYSESELMKLQEKPVSYTHLTLPTIYSV